MTEISKDVSAKKVRVVKDAQLVAIGVQTTTASYVDLSGSKVDTATASTVAFVIKNTHATATIKYKVMASIADVDAEYVEVQAEASLAAVSGVGTYAVANPPYRYYKVKVIDNSGHGTASGSVLTKD